jgi:hypothetical protein
MYKNNGFPSDATHKEMLFIPHSRMHKTGKKVGRKPDSNDENRIQSPV